MNSREELLAAKLENANDISVHSWDPIKSWSEEYDLTGEEQAMVVAALRNGVAQQPLRDKADEAAMANVKEAWAALAMIREAVETLGPSGAMKASEHLDGPTFTHEADALVGGIIVIASMASTVTSTTDRCEPPGDCDWPNEPFTFHDNPGEHDPCYVVMPGGAMIPLNHHAGEGVDIARAKFIITACNAALSPDFSRKAVGEAMQDAWNEICSDTDCHPLDIEHQGKKLFFKPGHWVALTAKFLFVNWMRSTLTSTDCSSPTRMDKGRAFYLAMYEKNGAVLAANDHWDLWCDMAEDYERRLATLTSTDRCPK